MSGPAALSPRLPDGEANGLAPIVRALVETPHEVHAVVALIDTARITERIDDGTRVPTVRIRRIEAITDPDDRDHLRRLIVREYERRTGQAVLPFDLEEDLRRVLGAAPLDRDTDGDGDPS